MNSELWTAYKGWCLGWGVVQELQASHCLETS